MKHGCVLLAYSHLNILGGVHNLLDALFGTVFMVANERSLMEAVTAWVEVESGVFHGVVYGGRVE